MAVYVSVCASIIRDQTEEEQRHAEAETVSSDTRHQTWLVMMHTGN